MYGCSGQPTPAKSTCKITIKLLFYFKTFLKIFTRSCCNLCPTKCLACRQCQRWAGVPKARLSRPKQAECVTIGSRSLWGFWLTWRDLFGIGDVCSETGAVGTLQGSPHRSLAWGARLASAPGLSPCGVYAVHTPFAHQAGSSMLCKGLECPVWPPSERVVLTSTGSGRHMTASLRAHKGRMQHALTKMCPACSCHPHPRVPQSKGCACASKHQKQPVTLLINVFLTLGWHTNIFSSTPGHITSVSGPRSSLKAGGVLRPLPGKAVGGVLHLQTQREEGSVAIMRIQRQANKITI